MRTTWLTVPVGNLRRGSSDVDVWTAQWDGPSGGPVFVCVHGLGGSHLNWALLAPLLAQSGAVYAPDLAGFGLTPPTGRRATFRDNLDLLGGFIATVSPDRPVVVLGNSMGGLMSILLAAKRPALVAATVLIAPASPRPLTAVPDREVLTNFAIMATPVLGERMLALRQRRITPEQQVRQTMLLCAADPSALDEDSLAAHVEMVTRRRKLPYARSALLQASRSLMLLVGPRANLLWEAIDAVQAPTLLLHGARDRLVTAAGVAVVAQRRPDWTFVGYDDLGHVPMLEAPTRVGDDIRRWLERTELHEAAVS